MKSEAPNAPVVDVEPAWQCCRLADLVDDRGITYGVVQPGHAQAEGTPILRVANLTAAGLELNDVMRIAPAIAARYSRSRLRGGEVLITLVGSVGQVAVAPPDVAGWNVARAVGVIPVRPEIPARWVAWCLRAPQARRYLEDRLNTTVQSTLNLRDLGSVEIPMPPPGTMGAITSILGALDDKIDSNRRLARLLEQVGQTEFQARFVDFVGVVDLTESELGSIPAGWKVGVLSDIGAIHRDLVKGTSGMPYIGLDLMPRGSTVLTDWREQDAPAGQAAQFEVGDILFGKLRPYFRKVGVAPIAGRCSTEILVLRPVEPDYYGVLLGHVASEAFIEHCVAVSRGTRMPRAEWNDASAFKIAIPPDEVAAAFTAPVQALYAKIRYLTHESRTLASIRDTLLPKLISGQIRVPDTAVPDNVIEAVVDDAA
jgi:type I restriction enzyme, S subunit